jgi:HEAT repeat protein/beta-lactamase regulating signal transducer with metallopeptidase domain
VNPVELVGWSLVHSVWEGAIIALALGMFLKLVDQRRATLRYAAAVVALLLVVVLPPLTALRTQEPAPLAVPLIHNPDPNPLPQESYSASESGFDVDQKSAESGTISPREETGSSIPPVTWAAIRPYLRQAFPWLVGLWALGVLILSCRLLGAWLRARQLRVDGTSGVDPSYQQVLELIVAKLGVLRPVRLLQSTIIQVPAVIGWLRPVVLIPATLINGLTVPQLEAILAHELAHIRRHDYLVNLLQALVETLLFYHPAVWWISRQARQEREHCCDDVAIRACGDRRLYAGALLTLEEHRAMTLMPAATGGDLLARIRRIAAPRLSHAETSPRWLAGILAVSSALTVAVGAVVLGPRENLAAQDVSSKLPGLSDRNAAVAPDTVIRHPDPSAPLTERWEWAQQLARGQRYPIFWVGYTIEPMPWIEGSIYIGRLERHGITGEGGLSLRGRITNFGNFDGFRVPGVMLAPLVGGGMPDDVALLFAFVPDSRGRPVLARVHVSSLRLPVDLEDRPLLWLGDASDEQSIPVVRSLFESAPRELRQDVVAAVGVHGSREAVAHLSRWLTGGEDSDVREEAAEWLGRHPDPGALALLARTARDDRAADVRREAAEAVSEMPLPAATDTLVVLARRLQDIDARREAVEGLAERQDPRAMAAAVEIARNDPNMDVRREAVETLGEFKDGAGVTHLIELARSDRSTDIRMEAVETLAEAGKPEQVVGILRKIVEEDPNEDVAREAVETLGDIDDPQIPRILRDLARQHPRAEVRKEAIETLSEMAPGGETVSVLSEIARSDQDPDVQDEALESLAELGDPEADKLVAEVARTHPNQEVRRNAVERLAETLPPMEALDELKAIARSDASYDIQVEATETIGELPDEMAIPALAELARSHPNEDVRVEAIETLGEQEDHDRVVEMFKGILEGNSSEQILAEVIETLGEIGTPQAVELISRAARTHSSPEVRLEAMETLAEIGAPGVVDLLSAAATGDASFDVQEEAVESLAELDDGAGVPSLIRIARDHPSRELRSKALSALGESDDPRAREAIQRMLQ